MHIMLGQKLTDLKYSLVCCSFFLIMYTNCTITHLLLSHGIPVLVHSVARCMYLGSLNSIFLVEEGVDWGREDVDTTLHDSPLCA